MGFDVGCSDGWTEGCHVGNWIEIVRGNGM